MSIKTSRAAKLTPLSAFPRTWATLIEAIPAAVIRRCTSREIASIANAMRTQYDIGHKAGWSDAQ